MLVSAHYARPHSLCRRQVLAVVLLSHQILAAHPTRLDRGQPLRYPKRVVLALSVDIVVHHLEIVPVLVSLHHLEMAQHGLHPARDPCNFHCRSLMPRALTHTMHHLHLPRIILTIPITSAGTILHPIPILTHNPLSTPLSSPMDQATSVTHQRRTTLSDRSPVSLPMLRP
ncbi:hypothetical protein T439DRAFT_15252 [Meredithblackwellia eburnea MCA 4105]